MKILALSPFMPFPPDHGGRIRTYLLLRELARLGHGVHLIALMEREEERDRAAALEADGIRTTPVLHTRRFGRLTWTDRLRKAVHLLTGHSDVLSRFTSPAALKAARRLEEGPWDIVLSELLWTAPLALRLEARCSVLNAHNVETLIARRTAARTPGFPARWIARLEARGMGRDEARLVRDFDTVIVVSEADRRHMESLDPGLACTVIGNCVDTDVLKPLPPPPPEASPVCLFMGSANYPPNREAIETFARGAFPRVRRRYPDARFLAVGADPPESLKRLEAEVPGVEVAGYVDDILPVYRESTVVVVPIRVGGGTRTKILEALALGRPVVSTAVGAEGLDLEHPKHLLIAGSEEAFVRAVVSIHEDRNRLRALVETGRARVEAHASAHRSGILLERILLDTLHRKRQRQQRGCSR